MSRRLTRAIAALTVLFVAFAWSVEARQKRRGPTRRRHHAKTAPALPQLHVESAGEHAEVQVWLGNALAPAGALIVQLDRDPVPLRSARELAAVAALYDVAATTENATPLWRRTADGIAVGFALQTAKAPPGLLVDLLARLATVPTASSAALKRARTALAEHDDGTTEDVEPIASSAALALLYPGASTERWVASDVSDDEVTAALAEWNRSPFTLRFVGSPGLAKVAQSRFRSRLQWVPGRSITATSTRPRTLLIDTAGSDPAPGEELAILVGLPEKVENGRWLALLAEALREGDGSLAQRLGVACGTVSAMAVEERLIDQRGGALLLTARVGPDDTEAALNVLQGMAGSLESLALREEMLGRAHRRLQIELAELKKSSALLLVAFINAPQRLIAAASPKPRLSEFRAALRTLTAPGQEVTVLVGQPSDRVVPAGTRRVSLERFDPNAPDCERPRTEEEAHEDFARAGEALARELLLLLSHGQERRAAAFHSRYHLREQTPLGAVEGELNVSGDGSRTLVSVRHSGWTMEASSSTDGAEVMVHGQESAAQPLTRDDRVGLLALRQPALLAQAVLDGRVVGYSALAPCEQGTCPALRAEGVDGSRMLLLLDQDSRRPRSLKVWWAGGASGRGPDEEVRYLAWIESGGVAICSDLEVRDARGGDRRLSLVDWGWANDAR